MDAPEPDQADPDTQESESPDQEATGPSPADSSLREEPRRSEPVPVDWRRVERRQRGLVAVLTGVLALAYFASLVAYRGPGEALRDRDARAYFAYLPSIVIDRDLDLSNQFELLFDVQGAQQPFGEAANGAAANPYSIAPALLWLPGYVIGVIVDRAAASMGVDTGPDGYGTGAIWGVALASLVLTGFAADLSRRVAAQLRGPEFAMPAMLLAWFGSAAFAHVLEGPVHPQSAAWFCIALTLWLGWLSFRDDGKWLLWLPAGVAGGVAIGIWPQNAALLIVPGLLLLRGNAKPRKLRRAAAAGFAGIGIGYLPAPAGAFWLRPVGSDEVSSETLWQALLSPTEGWLVSTPLVALGLFGLIVKARASRSSIARWVAAGSLAAAVLLVVADAMSGSPAVPARLRFVAATPIIVFGLTQVIATLDRHTELRVPGMAVLFGLAAVNVWLLLG